MHPHQFKNGEPDDLDARLRDSLHRVHVPSDLAERLQAAVRRAAQRDSCAETADQELTARDLALEKTLNTRSYVCVTDDMSASVQAEFSELPTMSTSIHATSVEARRLDRRRLLLVTAAASVTGVVGGYFYYANAQPLEQSVVKRYCLSRLNELDKQQLTWQEIREDQRQRLAAEIQHLPTTLRLASECNLPADNYINGGRAIRINARNGIGLILFDLAIARPIANLHRYFVPLHSNSGVWGLIGLHDRGRVFVLAGLCKEAELLGLVGAAQPI